MTFRISIQNFKEMFIILQLYKLWKYLWVRVHIRVECVKKPFITGYSNLFFPDVPHDYTQVSVLCRWSIHRLIEIDGTFFPRTGVCSLARDTLCFIRKVTEWNCSEDDQFMCVQFYYFLNDKTLICDNIL